jgi:peptidoglycan/LPS O-acetylase OafA/YrhL
MDDRVRDNNIDTLRFFGAFLVLFGHTFVLCYGPGGEDPISEWMMRYTGYRAALPGLGVAMFFVLSGYLVTKSYVSRQNLLAYVEARILRIYPALWVTLLFTVFILGPLVTSMSVAEYFSHRGTWNYLQHNARLFPDVVYKLPGVFLENPRSGGVNGSLWSLPIEVRMYLIVAVLGVLGVFRRRWAFNVIAIAIVIFYVVAPEHFFLLPELRRERLGVYFLLGALFYINRDVLVLHWAGLLLLGAVAATSFNYGKEFYNLVFAVFFCYLTLYIAFHQHIKFPNLGSRGDFSYGLYLYAFPMTQLGIMLLGPDYPWLIVVTTFISSMLLAMFSWHFIERPSLRLKGKLSTGLKYLLDSHSSTAR